MIPSNLHQIILTFLVLFTFQISYSQDPNFHIYLCFGQSNMEGQGIIEQQDQIVDDRFQILSSVSCSQNGRNAEQWYTATPPLCRCNNGLGPADYFGRTMIENLPDNIRIGIVHVAIGGCDIALFDKYNYATYVATAPDWMQYAINDYGGNPYGRLIELAQIAKQDGVIKGILMHQGETNTGQSDWPLKVKGVYDNLIADLELNADEVPFLLGEVFQGLDNCCSAHNSIIAQVPSVIPNSYVISSTGLGGVDVAHFTSEAYRTLGVRYAEQMLQLIEVNEGIPSITITEPSESLNLDSPANITITASATDADGNIVNVQFYVDSTHIGESSTAPYSMTWENVEAGIYSISAVATDNDGNIAISESISVRVNAPVSENTITVRARGVIGGEIINLEVDGTVVQTWTLTTTYEDYSAEANVNGVIWINYTNDAGDLDAQIDYISIGDTVYQAEDQAINTGLYANGACGGGGYGEFLHCAGYIEFETAPIVIVDNCPDDPNKTEPGECGCGIPEGTCNNTPVQLNAGWNIIGCPVMVNVELETALAEIIDNVEVVKDNENAWVTGSMPFLNSLTQFEYGKGYLIKVSNDCILNWEY